MSSAHFIIIAEEPLWKIGRGTLRVKYLGDKPRGFTVWTAPLEMSRVVAGEFNSPRPSQEGLVGINTRTLDASVRVGGSTPPDSTRRTTPKTRILRGAAFPNCQTTASY